MTIFFVNFVNRHLYDFNKNENTDVIFKVNQHLLELYLDKTRIPCLLSGLTLTFTFSHRLHLSQSAIKDIVLSYLSLIHHAYIYPHTRAG